MADVNAGIDLSSGFNALVRAKEYKEQKKTRDLQNALAQSQIDERDQNKTLNEMVRVAKAYQLASVIAQSDPDKASSMLKSVSGPDANITSDGNTIDMTIGSIHYVGPRKNLDSFFSAANPDNPDHNPTFFNDPNKIGIAIRHLAMQPGVTKLEVKDPNTGKSSDLKRLIEERQQFKEEGASQDIISAYDKKISGTDKAPTQTQLYIAANAGDKEAQSILDKQKQDKIEIAKGGRAYLKNIPTSTPGVFFDRGDSKFYKNDQYGNKVELTSNDYKREALKYKEEMPTNDIRVMQQSVPSVKQLITQTRSALEKTLTGPLAGRWKKAWSTKIGAADPDFRKLSADVGLLQTRLMKMHVGARGGEYIMKHFEDIINAGKDAPENLTAALDEIERYANEVGMSLEEQRANAKQGISSQAAPEQQNIPATNSRGWTLMTDANGNKAYVSPDGSQFEEVQ